MTPESSSRADPMHPVAVVETVLVVLVRGSSGNDGSSDDDKSRLFYVLLGASISVLSTEL